jgi:hypothetical protein
VYFDPKYGIKAAKAGKGDGEIEPTAHQTL